MISININMCRAEAVGRAGTRVLLMAYNTLFFPLPNCQENFLTAVSPEPPRNQPRGRVTARIASVHAPGKIAKPFKGIVCPNSGLD